MGFSSLQASIGYRFSDEALIEQALTHRSVGSRNNERLEFLGDGALNFIIASELFSRFPELEEGDLSRLRAELVNKRTLAHVARDLKLGDRLNLGPGELKSGGFRRDSILADALEAVIGAIFLDAGFEVTNEVVLRLFHRRIEDMPPVEQLKDPKTRLQEFLQAHQRELPDYQLIKTSGADHKRQFRVSCQVQGLAECVVGEGRSRRKAEQRAAAAALELLQPAKQTDG